MGLEFRKEVEGWLTLEIELLRNKIAPCCDLAPTALDSLTLCIHPCRLKYARYILYPSCLDPEMDPTYGLKTQT